MRIDFDIDLGEMRDDADKDGLVAIKLKKDTQARFKELNKLYNKRLSLYARLFIEKLVSTIDDKAG